MTGQVKKLLSFLVISFFNCLPMKKNKLFFFSYYGSQYGCSPKYITEYILKHYPEGQFDIVWAFNDPVTKSNLTGFRKVKTMSLKYFYELCTAKVVITNFRTTDLYVKRKKQYYIQTWHSSLRLKQIEKDVEKSLPAHYVQMAKKDSKKCDLLLSGCKYSTEIFKRAFWYDGEILEQGTPANDILVNQNFEYKKSVYEKLNINLEHKIVLYAPTFRKDSKISVYDLHYDDVLKSLEERFGQKWILLIRLHPHLSNISDQMKHGENILNVTAYDDVQELMLAADVLITDYSSMMFSFLLTKKPCFLYVPDLKEYSKNDRKLYFNLKDLPFVNAETNQDICTEIKNFNEESYLEGVSTLMKNIHTYESGNACENLLRKIEQQVK